jgi:hypothetical protein
MLHAARPRDATGKLNDDDVVKVTAFIQGAPIRSGRKRRPRRPDSIINIAVHDSQQAQAAVNPSQVAKLRGIHWCFVT